MSNKKEPAVKISILVPIYNVEKYLRQCLDSLVNQTLKDIEIICLNDGSTDSSPDMIKEYAKNDSRIIIVNQKNSGYGDSMNKGLKKASGEYIGIVESDDFIELNAFERLYGLAKKFGADVARSNYFHFKDGNNTKYDYVDTHDTGRLIDPASRTWIFYQAPAIWSAIYKRSFIEEHKIDFLPTPGASYQDTGFNFKVWASTHKAVFTDEAFLHYRLDNESSSVNNPGKVYNVCKEYAEIEDYLRRNKIYDNYAEIMQMAKFGAYYWNIYRLTPDLRRGFIKKVKKEFLAARNEGSLNESLFLNADQWNLLNYILDHNVSSSLKYIKTSGKKVDLKQKIKKLLKKICLTIRPTYKKQLEISSLIQELENENMFMKQKVKELERKINSDKDK